MQPYFVYIVSDTYKELQVGMTTDLENCVQEATDQVTYQSDKPEESENKLIYFEHFLKPAKARKREADIGSWRSEKILELIEFVNPEWFDLTPNKEEARNFIGLNIS